MEEVDALIVEAKQLIGRAENALKKIETAEPTQLRIVVNRLRLFLEQHGIGAEAATESKATESKTAAKPKAAA